MGVATRLVIGKFWVQTGVYDPEIIYLQHEPRD